MIHEIQGALAEHVFAVLVAGCLVIGMLVRAVTTILTTASREQTRREIAAYVAEGSISADEGERLLRTAARRAA